MDTFDEWYFQRKERERGDSKKRRGKPSGETLRARVSEIRHRANFPKAERWLSFAAYTANRSRGSNLEPPIAHHLPRGNCHPEHQQQRCCPSRFTICFPLFFFLPLKKRQNAKSHRSLLYTRCARLNVKTLLSFSKQRNLRNATVAASFEVIGADDRLDLAKREETSY